MLYIPPTTPHCYVSSIVALNIHSPQGTGDWHSAQALATNAYPQDFFLYGVGQKHNTLHLLGTTGVIDGTPRLNHMGYFVENAPVWIADHPRACFDYLYTAVLQTGNIGRLVLDEFFPVKEDKEAVYTLIKLAKGTLYPNELEVLNAWIARNPCH